MTVRINWFPDPNITQTVKPYAPSTVKVDFPVVARRNWLRATVLTVGDGYAQYSLQGDRLPPAGTYHVHCCAFAKHANAFTRVYTKVGGKYTVPLQKEIADGTTVDVDGTITIPDGCEELIIRTTAGNVVGAIGMMSDILIERADTYDTAVGGASGLLHRGHDAARIGASVGRVMSDDDNEPMHEPILDHHLASRQVGASHDRSERERDDIFGQFRCERHRRHCLDYRNTGRIQRTPTCQLHDVPQQFRSAISELFRQVRQSDRHRDKYTHLHAGRVSGEQDPARRHRIFRRGYDAARLTLMGVMA